MMGLLLNDRNDRFTLEAGGHSCLVEGDVADMCEDIFQLLHTVLEHMSWYDAWTRSLLGVQSGEISPHR